MGEGREERKEKGKNKNEWPGMVLHAFNHSALRRQREADLCDLEGSLVHIVSLRSTRATQ